MFVFTFEKSLKKSKQEEYQILKNELFDNFNLISNNYISINGGLIGIVLNKDYRWFEYADESVVEFYNHCYNKFKENDYSCIFRLIE